MLRTFLILGFLFGFIFLITPGAVDAAGLVACGGTELDGAGNRILQPLEDPVPAGWAKFSDSEMMQLEPTCELCHIFKLVKDILDIFLFPFVPIIGGLLFAIGGFFMFIGGANPQMLSRGKSILIATIVGLIIIYTSWLFINFFLSFMGFSTWGGVGNWWEIDCALPISATLPFFSIASTDKNKVLIKNTGEENLDTSNLVFKTDDLVVSATGPPTILPGATESFILNPNTVSVESSVDLEVTAGSIKRNSTLRFINHLENPGFETGDLSTWKFAVSTLGGTVTVVTTESKSGAFSVALQKSGPETSPNVKKSSTRIPVWTDGTTIRFQAWVKGTDDGNGKFEFWIEKAYLYCNVHRFGSTPVTAAWQKLGVTTTLSAAHQSSGGNATCENDITSELDSSMHIGVGRDHDDSDSEIVWFDDFFLTDLFMEP